MTRAAVFCEWLKPIAVFLLPLILFSGCGEQAPPPEPPAKIKHAHHVTHPQQPEIDTPPKLESDIVYPASAYIQHLSLAELTLEAGANESAPALADFDIARAYSLQGQTDNVLQPAVIIDYALKDAKAHELVAIPFTMPKDTSDFVNLEEIMRRMNDFSYTMYDLRLGVLKLPPPSPLPAAGEDANQAKKLAEETLQPLIKGALPLPPMAQARIYLQLARFFTRQQYKEPAYLAIENARQSLAMVDENSTQAVNESERDLTREIDAEEALLHKTMPFTLNF